MTKEHIKFIENYLGVVTKALRVKPTVTVENAETILNVVINGENLNFLIGRGGESLSALQHLMGIALMNKFGEWVPVVVDINDYRTKRKEKTEEIAKSYIDRVRFFNKEVALPAMSSFERKQVHEFVSGYDDVESFSVGEGRDRHVVLKPTL